MSAPYSSTWQPRLSALILAALAAGSTVAWSLLLRGPNLVMAPATAPLVLQVDASTLARALGAPDAQVASRENASLAASRMVLAGVVAHSGRDGAALISLDGKEPKPVAVGTRVNKDWVLAAVGPRRATLRDAAGAQELTLEMPNKNALFSTRSISP